MSESIKEREQLWNEFLAVWPIGRLATMSLDEYSLANSKDCFTYWLEERTEKLGSIWGGFAFKFGIYARRDLSPKTGDPSTFYGEKHAWLSKYGASESEAFEGVRRAVLSVAKAASDGDAAAVEAVDLGPMVKWKIAFLYQDRGAPQWLSLFNTRDLCAALGRYPDSKDRISDLQTKVRPLFPDSDVLVASDACWQAAREWTSKHALSERLIAQLNAEPERFTLVNATKKLIGYQLNGHPPFALVREEKTVTAFAPVGAWTKACAELIKRRYEPGDPRHSNLTSCCPQAGLGHAAVALKIDDEAAFDKFVAALEGKESLDSLDPAAEEEKLDNAMHETQVQQPLNQILYGPPGTGKTYSTIDAALEILDPEYLDLHLTDRAELKARFDQLSKEQRIRFVTFHQSFSYEDFVEGLRAHSQDGTLQYRVEPGVFLQLCEAARRAPAGKKTLDGALDDFLEELAKQSAELTTVQGKVFRASYRPGHDTVICFPQSSQTGMPSLPNIENIRAVLRGEEPENLSLPSYVHGIANYVRARFQAQLSKTPGARSDSALPYVLIIDEINRGNISRIFGELITLIEPSKRAGADEALQVLLPYSKKLFSVPQNVYLIGTMNTADRSLTGMDVALRRRFVFKEMPPRPELLDKVIVAGVVPVGQLLRVLNQRIEALLDRDHCLGHANFMALRETPTIECLAQIFRNQVLPLLQEYFFDDWQRIQWVLNDHRKPAARRFVDSVEVDKARLFGRDADVNVAGGAKTWSINEAAFLETASYLSTLGPEAGGAEVA